MLDKGCIDVDEKFLEKKSMGIFFGQIFWFVIFKFDMLVMWFVCEDSLRYFCFFLQNEIVGNVGVVFVVLSGFVVI